MSDYLRARIDALQNEVTNLKQQVEFLSAQLEVSQNNDNSFPENYLNTIKSDFKQLNSTKQ